jgi:hypothetical protein
MTRWVVDCRLSPGFWRRRSEHYWHPPDLYPFHIDTLINGGLVLFCHSVLAHDGARNPHIARHLPSTIRQLLAERSSTIAVDVDDIEVRDGPTTGLVTVSILVSHCTALPVAGQMHGEADTSATEARHMGPLLLWATSPYHVDTLASFGREISVRLFREIVELGETGEGQMRGPYATAWDTAREVAREGGGHVEAAGGALYDAHSRSYTLLFNLTRDEASTERLIVHVDRAAMSVTQYEVMPFPPHQ